jgi:hypothetical protein
VVAQSPPVQAPNSWPQMLVNSLTHLIICVCVLLQNKCRSQEDLDYHAQSVAFGLMQNCGHNCIALEVCVRVVVCVFVCVCLCVCVRICAYVCKRVCLQFLLAEGRVWCELEIKLKT